MTSVRTLLAKYSIYPTKRRGQHFLMDKRIMMEIIQTAEVNLHDMVLEVGPGLGEMTKLLASRAKRVIAIEVDESMVTLLKDRLADYDNIVLHRGDALKFDFLSESRKWGEKLKVVSNLPYNISTQLLFRFVEMREAFSGMTLMFQKEVAERIVAIPGGRQYGVISVLLQLYCNASIRRIVPSSSFYPRPKVESAVVRFDLLQKPRVEIEDEAIFRKVVKASFGHRRKTLKNALKNVTFSNVNGEGIEVNFRKAGIDPGRRGETLTLREFAALSEVISEGMTSIDNSPDGDFVG
ncbi:MAG: ribosomal RNA small subunit methyltransferase A [Syntrophobacterales bacterium]|nr:MAG: ribosomal RNA small subunit methyltransferase A [Syntrophobacterales bacterium]